MFSNLEVITPAIARDVLANHNPNVRPISRERVRRYAEEMRDGRWVLSPDGLSFDANGKLVNGQHRLAALAQADVELPFWVTRNVDPTAGAVLDQGLARTAAQIAAMTITSDVPASKLTSAARIVLEHGSGVTKPSNTQINEYVHRNQDVLERYAPLSRAYKAGTHAAFAFAELSGLQGVQDAARRLAEMDWCGEGDPMRALARSLATVAGQGARAQRSMFHTTMAALEYVNRGEPLTVARKFESMPPRVRSSIATAGGDAQ